MTKPVNNNEWLTETMENLEVGVINLYGEFHEEALSLLFGGTAQAILSKLETIEQEAYKRGRIDRENEINTQIEPMLKQVNEINRSLDRAGFK